MAPNHQVSLGHDLPESSATAVPAQEDDILEDEKLLSPLADDPTSIPSCSADTADQQEPYLPLKWHNIIAIGIFHIVALYGFCIAGTDAMWSTLLFSYVIGQLSGIGVTGGVHRLWTHRSYKAKLPLRIMLSIFFAMAGQNTIYDWVRDHRVHHKYSETDADPHNANRGFFFAHVGWLMKHKHPEVLSKGKKIDMSDVLADPVVQFHQKFFIPMKVLFCFLIPTIVPHYLWGETWRVSFLVSLCARYMFGLNFTWLVNSAAHIWGSKPYDKQIFPAQNKLVAILALGEGWHNYHHVFPWDYKTAELGDYGYNYTTAFIDFMAWIGWAYDRKVATSEMIKKRIQRTGDGSHPSWGTVGGEIIHGEDDTKEY